MLSAYNTYYFAYFSSQSIPNYIHTVYAYRVHNGDDERHPPSLSLAHSVFYLQLCTKLKSISSIYTHIKGIYFHIL